MSFHKIIIIGNLGRDPELRYTPQGTPVCNFPVATNERWRDSAGEWQDRTTWFRVTAWGKLAEIANQYLSKGRQVYVEGRLSVQEYTDRNGVLRTSLEVRASDIHFIGQRSTEIPEDVSQPAASQTTGAPQPAETVEEPPTEIEESEENTDDVPF